MKNITTTNLIEILKTISAPDQPFTEILSLLGPDKIVEKNISSLQKKIALELVRRGVSPLALS